MTTILHLDTSVRGPHSVTRDLTSRITARFPEATVIRRDLGTGLPLIGETWVNANTTPAPERSPAQKAILAQSDELIGELRAADIVVVGLPIYNWGVPATFKAWADLVARAGETFSYQNGAPVGLLHDKRAIIAMASGGTQVGSAQDFASGYAQTLFGMLGIRKVNLVRADRTAIDAEASLAAAHAAIDTLSLAA